LWPYIVQFSYVIYDTDINDIIKIHDSVVNIPDNIVISKESINIHGITRDVMNKKGKDLQNIIVEFMDDFENVDLIVGHNISFDLNMLKVEIMRKIGELYYFENELFNKFLEIVVYSNKYCCTMQETVDLCAIEATSKNGTKYIKFPKLVELHNVLFGTNPSGLHNSLNDVLVCLRCFMKIHHKIDILDSSTNFKKLYSKLL
jgi:DNA polymerase III epsilon subunit-like protein